MRLLRLWLGKAQIKNAMETPHSCALPGGERQIKFRSEMYASDTSRKADLERSEDFIIHSTAVAADDVVVALAGAS